MHYGLTMTQPRTPHLQLAGMALNNGVLIIGPTHWSAAIRQRDGSIATATRSRRQLGGITRIPALRGPARLADMMLMLPAVRRALPAARLPMESPRILSVALAGSLLHRNARRILRSSALSDSIAPVASLAGFLAMLRTADLASYHGAEHKVIGGYEQGIPAHTASKEHERCGTHLAVPMTVVNTASTVLMRALLPRSPQMAAACGAAVGIAASTELMRSMQRSPGASPLTRCVHRMGMTLQSIASTREPSPEQLDVARAALEAVLAAEARSNATYD